MLRMCALGAAAAALLAACQPADLLLSRKKGRELAGRWRMKELHLLRRDTQQDSLVSCDTCYIDFSLWKNGEAQVEYMLAPNIVSTTSYVIRENDVFFNPVERPVPHPNFIDLNGATVMVERTPTRLQLAGPATLPYRAVFYKNAWLYSMVLER